MSRARRLFERARMLVIPVAADSKVLAGGTVSLRVFLPTAAALAQTEIARRESYCRLFYLVVR